MTIAFLIGGLLFGAYYLVLIISSGLRSSFSLFWLALSVLCWIGFVWMKLSRHFPGKLRLPLQIRVFLITTLALGLVLFTFVESRIVGEMIRKEPEAEPRFMIVLGAKVRGTTLSRTLKQRLDTAAAYWKEHPEVIILVSGGQGEGEDVSEARAMENYLLSVGVNRSRMIREEESINTRENLQNCFSILQYTKEPVLLVTSDYHVFRAKWMAGSMTDRPVEGLAAPTDWIFLPNYMVREFFAVVKEWFLYSCLS